MVIECCRGVAFGDADAEPDVEELRAALASVLGEERAHIAAPSGSCLLLDPDHPTRQSWREEGARLEAMAGDMLRPEDIHAPYLDAVPGAREAVRQAAEEVADALQHDRYRAFGWLTKEVNRQARETGTEAFHVPRYNEMIAQAEALSAQAARNRTREGIAAAIARHRQNPIAPLVWPGPYLLEKRFFHTDRADAEMSKAGAERVDAQSVRFRSDSILDIIYR